MLFFLWNLHLVFKTMFGMYPDVSRVDANLLEDAGGFPRPKALSAVQVDMLVSGDSGGLGDGET